MLNLYLLFLIQQLTVIGELMHLPQNQVLHGLQVAYRIQAIIELI